MKTSSKPIHSLAPSSKAELEHRVADRMARSLPHATGLDDILIATDYEKEAILSVGVFEQWLVENRQGPLQVSLKRLGRLEWRVQVDHFGNRLLDRTVLLPAFAWALVAWVCWRNRVTGVE